VVLSSLAPLYLVAEASGRIFRSIPTSIARSVRSSSQSYKELSEGAGR
jgi:hypothetical protein